MENKKNYKNYGATGYKRHKVEFRCHNKVVPEDFVEVIPLDTSVTSLMKYSINDKIELQYTGDVPINNYQSAIERKEIADNNFKKIQSTNNQLKKEKQIEDFQKTLDEAANKKNDVEQ